MNRVHSYLPNLQVRRKPPIILKSLSLNFLDNCLRSVSSPVSRLTVARTQKYFRTRENRNFSTVRSTESRIIWFSIVESLLIIALSGFQVFVVRTFFQKNRKGYV